MGGAGNNFALKNSDVDLCIDTESTFDVGVFEVNNLAAEFRKQGQHIK
jgi:hypothetical protein